MCIFLSLLLGLMAVCALSQDSLGPKEWRQDLEFLQKEVHREYPFLFKKISSTEWDEAVMNLHAEIPRLEEHEIIVGFLKLTALFGYGHTDLSLRDGVANFRRLPLNLYEFSDGVFIQGTHRKYAKTLGAKVIALEGKPLSEVLEAIAPTVNAENEQYFKAYGLNYLLIPEILHAQGVTDSLSSQIRFTLETAAGTFDQVFEVPEDGELPPLSYGLIQQQGEWLDARQQSETPYYLRQLDKIYYYEFLPESKTMYVRQSQIQDEPSQPIPEFYEEVFRKIDSLGASRLVLDVRLNGGGNNYKNKPVITGVIRADKINKPGKFFVILGRRTFSACQNLVNELHTYTNVIFVGEPTAENINFYGDNNRLVLPNSKLVAYLSFAWWQDKPQWENQAWLAPHIGVVLSSEDYKENRDPVLQQALSFDGHDFIMRPMEHLRTLFEAGKLEDVRTEAKRMVADSRYKFFAFEEEFSNIGVKIMESGDYQTAIIIFELNAELFPDSAGVWYKLAEAQLRVGAEDNAAVNYQKALVLDPGGEIGETARLKLQGLKK